MNPDRPGTVLRAMHVLAFLLTTLVVSFAQAWEAGSDGLVPIPALKQRVTDLTGALPASDAQALDAKLAAWESTTGNQLAVLVVPSTKPEPIEAYSIRVADAWKIGRKGRDNGVLLVVARDDKKLRIEVGYGFEGVLNDATARRIIAEDIVPSFQGGRFAEGVGRGVDRIIAVVDKGEPAAGSARPQQSSIAGAFKGVSLEMALAFVFFVVPVIAGILQRIFGRAVGSTVGAAIVAAGAWAVTGIVLIALVAALIAFVVILYMSSGAALSRRGGGVWTGSGGGGGGDFGGGGGFSGGWRRLRRWWRVGRLGLGPCDQMNRRMRRLWRHLITDRGDANRAFPAPDLARIEAAIANGELRHAGQVCFVLEASLPMVRVWQGMTPRQRALEVFGSLRVWDTEHNDGVLVYLLLADRDVEIVADRGIDGQVGRQAWESICKTMEKAFRAGRFAEGAEQGVDAIADLLAAHSPRREADRNELSDRPIVL